MLGNMDQRSHMAGTIRSFCCRSLLACRVAAEAVCKPACKALVMLPYKETCMPSCRAVAIHGDMDQHGRMATLADFKAGKQHVLVATDVAARGLDIKSIKSVVNYDAGKDIDTHVHRIGRTGRAGDKEGVAYTLVTPRETRFAGGSASRSVLGWCSVKPGPVEQARAGHAAALFTRCTWQKPRGRVSSELVFC